jgi:DTW domain-containing protein YfiP
VGVHTGLGPIEPRPYCYRCHKPSVLCVCDVPVVRNRTHVVILQHPRERQHPLGTERLARLGLASCTVHIAWQVEVSADMIPAGAALLYPSPHAVELLDLPASQRPSALVAIDGTWSQAQSLYKKNPLLASMPHVKLTRAPPSNYRIRREPREHYVSTIEALVHALRELEPDTRGLDGLLAYFASMIDRQLEFSKRPPAGSYRHVRTPLRTLHPDPLLVDPARTLVVAYTEYVVADDRKSGELVQVCLERLSDGMRLDALVRPAADSSPKAEHLRNMSLTRERLDAGVSLEELAGQLRTFIRPTDVLVAWSSTSLRLINALAPCPATLSLKGAYGNFTRSKPGDLGSLPAKHGAPFPGIHFSGRAGERMGNAVALTRWMASRPVGSG